MQIALAARPRALARLCLAAIGLVYAVLVTLYAVEVPRWNAPDEPAHFNYALQIAEQFQLPVLAPGDYSYTYLEQLKADRFPPQRPVDSLRYEGHQPPLYYLLAAGVLKAAAALGLAGQVLAIRLFSALLGLLLLAVAYHTIQRIFPGDVLLALGATALLAVTPMHLAVNAAAGNDPLANLVMAMILYQSAGIAKSVATRDSPLLDRPHLSLGVLLGLALLSKMTIYAGGGVVALAAVAMAARKRGAGFFARRAFFVFWIALVPSGWWFLRNATVYGPYDPFGLRRHAEVVVGQPLTGALNVAGLLDFAATTFRSFWGQFGWMGALLDARVYSLLAVYSLAALAGLALLALTLRQRRPPALAGHPALLLPLTVALVAAGMLAYSFSSFYQPQGRYLFPALLAIDVGFVAGLRRLVAPRLAPAVLASFLLALVVLDVAALYLSILPALRA